MRAWTISCALLVTLLGVGAARADETASAPPPADAEVTAVRSELATTIEQMSSTSRHVRDMLRDARRRGTRAQRTCLDETLSRADVALRNARALAADALAAYGRGDLEVARDARRRVLEWREAQRVAVRDGSACAPTPPKVQTQATTVRVEVDPNIAPAKL